jgi:hypothetical protein
LFLPLGPGWCKVTAYLLIAAVIISVTSTLRVRIGEKLVSRDIFGGGEFYLGMFSGVIRYALMITALLALLNAVSYSPKEVEASRKRMVANLGSDMFGWLHPAVLQDMALQSSFVGPQLRTHAGHLLISPAPVKTLASNETLSQKRNRQMDEILTSK